jgi:hypothetical protein
MSTPIGQVGTLAVLTIAICMLSSIFFLTNFFFSDAGYKMISGDKQDLKKNEHYKRATADYQSANAQGTDVKK